MGLSFIIQRPAVMVVPSWSRLDSGQRSARRSISPLSVLCCVVRPGIEEDLVLVRLSQAKVELCGRVPEVLATLPSSHRSALEKKLEKTLKEHGIEGGGASKPAAQHSL